MTGARYHTIVADPPWDHSDGTGFYWGNKHHERPHAPAGTRITAPSYQSLDLDAIKQIPVADIAASDSHLYLWTTRRFLRYSYDVAEAWGFEPIHPIVWCKAPKGFMGGTFAAQTEYVLFARRGHLRAKGRVYRDWFEWPRSTHSAKPEAFLDTVEQVSPGPYAELFARRARFGWDYPIGDQSLGGSTHTASRG